MIKTIFCDLGGVLLYIDPDHTAQHWSQLTGKTISHIRDTFPLEIHHEFEKGILSNDAFFKKAKAAMGFNGMTEIDFWSGWRKILGEETGAWNIIKKHTSTPVWLLSNTNPKHLLDDLIHKHTFFHEFDGMFLSYEMGTRKPEPDIYLKASQKVNLNPDQILFIDDMKENIDGASSLGFHTIHFTDIETFEINFQAKVNQFD